MTVTENLQTVRSQIIDAERRYGRKPQSVQLIVVSKMRAEFEIEAAFKAGQTAFAENYLQEACAKIEKLKALPIIWHFIGSIQTNKTRDIANYFDWVQSVSSEKIARRLHEQRRHDLSPLNILIQVNISEDKAKSGVLLHEIPALAEIIQQLPRLKLRGLMTIPKEITDREAQLALFQRMYLAFRELQTQLPTVDTLSMGMSADFIPAIQAGATMVRIGTAIFGQRTI